MFENTKNQYIKYIIIILCTFSLPFTGISQPPPTQLTPGSQGAFQLPTQMTQAEFKTAFEDGNKTGADVNQNATRGGKIERDSITKDNIKRIELTKMSTYGENVFPGPTTSVTELSTPPEDYPIGVGDNIVVALWGLAEYQNTYVVARDGSIFPKGLGKIIVQGLTFDNVRSIVASRFRSAVPPGTNIAVTLGQPRTISVNVVGNVNAPGPVVVSAFSNAFNVIGEAGGINEFADLRGIQIKRNGMVIETLDVYKYLNTGDFGKHVYLQNNDFVIVGNVQKKVLATGQWKRPMYYQLKKNEGIRALLEYTGGLTPDAIASNVKVLRSEDEVQVQHDVNVNAIVKLSNQDFVLNDGDIVKADMIREGIMNKIEITGEVKYPGVYEFRKNDRLFDLINRAGGVTRNTYLGRAYIFRGAGDSTNLKSDRLEVSLNEINDTINPFRSTQNIKLLPNDRVQLFNANDYTDPQYVEIFGEVRKEGRVRRYGGMTLEDLIYLSSGIKPSAEFGRLEIASIVDADSGALGPRPTRTVVHRYTINSNLFLDSAARKVVLRPYDQVFVRKNPAFEFQQNVEMLGLVKYPGTYSRLNKYERLSSYIQRAGGIAENANLSGAMLYRLKPEIIKEKLWPKPEYDSMGRQIFNSDSIRLAKLKKITQEPISIDLYRAMRYKNSKHDIILQEGDVILIPEIDPFVTIKGQVQSPLKISYDKQNSSLPFYIDKAGGFSERPWRKRIFVTYANGRSKRTKSFFFIRFYPKVEEGSVINVPMKPKGEAVVDAIKTTIISSIPVILTTYIFNLLKK